MANYQLTHLELSTRLSLAIMMLDPERPWGKVRELAEEYGVSRKFLYILQDQALEALRQGLLPHQAGRTSAESVVVVDDDFIQKAIAILVSVLPGSVRAVQLAIELLFGVHRGIGTISQTLRELGSEAQAYSQSIRLPIQVLGEADEIFQGRQPCLTLVDGRSFLVVSLSAQAQRDATTWGCVLLDAQKQGVQFANLASDGAKGIKAGAEAVSRQIPLCPDLFHLLQDAHRISRRLEFRAYQAIEQAERCRRAEREQQVAHRRKGRPLKVKLERPQAEEQEYQAIRQYDLWCWLLWEIRQALEPYSPQGVRQTAQQAHQTITTALKLLTTLHNPDVDAFVNQVSLNLDELIAPLAWLDTTLQPILANLPAVDQSFLLWAWQCRQALDLNIQRDLPSVLQPIAVACWDILALFHRSSSLAESLHSWLRPYLQAHRGMPQWLLPLLQLVWNHHPFQRGKRKGQSPLALAGIDNVLSLPELFERLIKNMTIQSEKPI
jgi:hypothetical protein